ncbi:phospholipid carrier-dependent glycosyltransferase [Nonomuraea phyllanthi]|uniref:Phospholipid carrier-dependent glycosyltransferase n=1 Tax=Nonomuraea phyllanthi TaxID=2219224 RepID=A0A5C4WMH9_9ACTN|nr:phospholipid carrier-dependent glycosyltransferase [Nonomuraea phyllanthi]KAB8194502.1 phospholipid carrier-dependent glycosyltransferase [Nonomuraea phyllanthi]
MASARVGPRLQASGILRAHRLFGCVLVLAAALRALVMLAYDTARLYWYDSFTYLDTAVHMKPPGAFHPAGYSWLLWALRPFHSVELIAGLQHAMGLGTGVMIYLMLRRRSLPAWGATLAAVPVLFDPAFLRLEHAVLSDELVIFLVVAALLVLLWRREVSGRAAVWTGGAAGVLLALAGLTRTATVPLIALAALCLLLRRASWRQAAALAVAGALPLLGYAGWYAQHHGRFALSGSDGVALWARTMTFADCSVIEPPPEQAPLCPNGAVQDAASEYVWDPRASLNRMPGDRFTHNDLARAFAFRAIAAQPLDYLREVAGDTSLAFTWEPVPHPKRMVPSTAFARGAWPLPAGQPLVDRVRREYDPDIRGMRSVEPYASILAAYPYPWFLHGTLFGVLLLVGGAGAVLRPRLVLLPWAFAVFLLVAPVAALDFDHRYVLPAIPVACVAAALAVSALRRPSSGRSPGRRPGGAITPRATIMLRPRERA